MTKDNNTLGKIRISLESPLPLEEFLKLKSPLILMPMVS